MTLARRRDRSSLGYGVPTPESYCPCAGGYSANERPPRNPAARILNAIVLISHVILPDEVSASLRRMVIETR